MKITVKIILACSLAFLLSSAFAQVNSIDDNTKIIDITVNKTTSIVFGSNIVDGDKGSREVLVRRAKGVNNILQLKAGRPRFPETNLTVITADGKLHHFFVRYADHPSGFTFEVDNQTNDALPLNFQSELTDDEMSRYSESIVASGANKSLNRDAKFDMRLSLQGIYIAGNIMFYHLQISNKSNIAYHPDVLRFFIKDKKKAKRTASQEIAEQPIYVHGSSQVINGKSTVDLVYAIPKFTIPDAKLLNIELMEHRGGRHLKLEIKNKLIVKAKAVNQ
jgi:conjugative transposon TraN protein